VIDWLDYFAVDVVLRRSIVTSARVWPLGFPNVPTTATERNKIKHINEIVLVHSRGGGCWAVWSRAWPEARQYVGRTLELWKDCGVRASRRSRGEGGQTYDVSKESEVCLLLQMRQREKEKMCL
jgi:hypothetical protein